MNWKDKLISVVQTTLNMDYPSVLYKVFIRQQTPEIWLIKVFHGSHEIHARQTMDDIASHWKEHARAILHHIQETKINRAFKYEEQQIQRGGPTGPVEQG